MKSQVPLDVLQRWMQQVITHPHGITAGLASDEAAREIAVDESRVEQVITRSQSLGSVERLAVYGNAYFARLLECLRDDYPGLRHAVGDETFDAFAMGYLLEHPSRNYTLGDLGRDFAEHLRQHRPADVPAPGWPDFLIDVARLERLYSEVFDGPGVEGQTLLSNDDLRRLSPDRIGDVRFHSVPCLRLIELQFPVHHYLSAVRRNEEPPIPPPEPICLVVTRRDFIVRRGTVTRPEFVLLQHLQRGVPLCEAIEQAADETDMPDDDFARELFHWFCHWTESGWFRGFT